MIARRSAGARYPSLMRDYVAAHTVQIALAILAAGLLFAILGIISALRASAKRTKNLREWAFRNGFEYIAGPLPASQLAPIPFFQLSETTSGADAVNIVRGSRGVYITLFDLEHTSRQRDSTNRLVTSSETTTCALFQFPRKLPRFEFTAIGAAEPGSIQGKLIGAVVNMAMVAGTHKGTLVPIEDRPGFLLLAFDEPERVREIFSSPHFFDDKRGFTVRAHDSWLLVSCDPTLYGQGWEQSKLVAVKNYDDYIAVAERIYDHFRHSSS